MVECAAHEVQREIEVEPISVITGDNNSPFRDVVQKEEQ